MNQNEIEMLKDIANIFKDKNESTVTTTPQTSGFIQHYPVHPSPCPTCGRCPTCGHGGYWPHWQTQPNIVCYKV